MITHGSLFSGIGGFDLGFEWATHEGDHGSYHRDGREKGATTRKQDAVGKQTYTGFNDRYEPPLKVNRRSVWEIPTQPYPEAHFATFPEMLARPAGIIEPITSRSESS